MNERTAIPTQGVLRLSASAGSGKTYSLTQLYLQQVLRSPTAYRGIVAITFTNKAANELKERILQTLETLTREKEAEKKFSEFGFDSPSRLSERAKAVLLRIVHDFDAFRVMTIDSFFQLLFSQLSYEAQLPVNLAVELDQQRVKNEVLEEGLKTIDESVGHILQENVLSVLSEKGKGWRPVRYLEESLLANLFQEEILDFQYKNKNETLSLENIDQARTLFETYIAENREAISDAAKAVVHACKAIGMSAKDFEESADLSVISRIATGKGEFSKTYKSHAKGKLYRTPAACTASALETVGPLLTHLYEAQNENRLANLALAESVLKNLSAIRLLLFFRSVLVRLNQQHSRILLTEIKYILRETVAGTDVPYLYERLGNQLSTLMIDEFQDTDKVQWSVLAPLAKTIADMGGFFAVVGDVKQSIYGWRGGDSALFKMGVNEALAPLKVEERPLETNYRSHARIVNFNNWLFSTFPAYYPDLLQQSTVVASESQRSVWRNIFVSNYADAVQKVSPTYENLPEQGFVEVRVRRKNLTAEPADSGEDEEEFSSFDWIIKDITRLQASGIPASEIAILVRNNRDLSAVVQLLDRKRRKEEATGIDFTFTAQSADKMEDHPLVLFLATCFLSLPTPSDYQFVLIEELAKTLHLESRFTPQSPGEKPEWRAQFEARMPFYPQADPLKTIDRIIDFFGLQAYPEHQYALVVFQNLLIGFLRNDSATYSDFATWWAQKASQMVMELPELAKGIQIMTIHKAKGLDFGVVILAINSNYKTDSLTNFDLWVSGGPLPWSAFPLLKAKAQTTFLHSEKGPDYEEKIYRQALETLNLWYVALTRPRYGLLVDITIGQKEALAADPKKPKSMSRIPIQIPAFMLGQRETLEKKMHGCSLKTSEDESDLPFRFQYGTVAKPVEPDQPKQEKSKKMEKWFPQKLGTVSAPIRWAKKEVRSEEKEFGKKLHQVLDCTTSHTHWQKAYQKIRLQQSADLTDFQWNRIEAQLVSFFSNEPVKKWFSATYSTMSEQEMWSDSGTLLRADRILKSAEGYTILDFKTGLEMEEHENQLRLYRSTLEKITGEPAKAYLVYLDPFSIKELAPV